MGTMAAVLIGVVLGPTPDSLRIQRATAIDLTGDGQVEELRFDISGSDVGDAQARLEIRDNGQVVYELVWPAQVYFGRNVVGPEAASEQLAVLEGVADHFFRPSAFVAAGDFDTGIRDPNRHPAALIARELGHAAPGFMVWTKAVEKGDQVFNFQTGRDGLRAIIWSSDFDRFFVVLECC